MKTPFLKWSRTTWSSILLFAVFFTSFFVVLFPAEMHHKLYKASFTVIYFSAIFVMGRHRRIFLIFTGIVILMEWISALLDVEFVSDISRGLTILFFLYMVGSLIRKIALAKQVTARVILEALNGYVLIGIVFAVIVSLMAQYYPGSFNFSRTSSPNELLVAHFSDDLYYSFITLATVGYGDFLPLKPISRSLATLIGVIGQMYIAVIIAMLVGKYSAQGSRMPEKEETDELTN
jgi:voltage-gated potassium channel